MFSKDLTLALCFAVFVTAFGSAFQHGYHTGVLNTPQRIVEDWLSEIISNSSKTNQNTVEINNRAKTIFAVITSIYAIGGLIGGILTQFWLGVFGLKWGLFMNNFLVVTSCGLMGFSKQQHSYIIFIIGRFLIGFNSGLNAGLAPMYLSEIAPISLRGGISSFYQLFITISILISQMVGSNRVFGREDRWPLLFALPILVTIMQVVLLPLLPDSPRYLMGLKKEEEALKALEWFRRRNTADVTKKEMDDIKSEVEAENHLTSLSMFEMFKNPIFRKPLIISCVVMIGQQLSGINGMVQYSTTTLESTSTLDKSTAQIGTTLMGAMNVAMTIISTLMVDIAGRKTLLSLGFGLMFVDTVLLFACMMIARESENLTAAYLSIAFLVMFVVFFAIGPGSIPWFLVQELFLPRARALAVGIAVPLNWLANFVVSLTYPIIQAQIKEYTLLIFAVFQLLLVIYIQMGIPETKNRSISDITAEFGIAESGTAISESGVVESGTAKPGTAESSTTESGTVKSGPTEKAADDKNTSSSTAKAV